MTSNKTGFYHPNPLALRYNNRGRSLQWWGSDTLENYDPRDNLYSMHDIEYKLNDDGFRCDELVKNSDVVFLGCSITEGIGVKQEETWAYKLLEMLKTDLGKDIPYCNLAIGGGGLDCIVRTFYNYRKRLRPKLVFALLPPYRRELYNFKNDNWYLDLIVPMHNEWKDLGILADPRSILYETQKNMAFLDLMLKDIDARMIWTNWGPPYTDNEIQIRSNRVLYGDRKGRDKIHPGPQAHLRFANFLYSEYSRFALEILG